MLLREWALSPGPGGGGVEERLQPRFGDARAVVADLEDGHVPLRAQRDAHVFRPLGVESGVFQQVGKHLTDEDGVHGHHHQFLRQRHGRRGRVKAGAVFAHGFGDDLLG